MKKYVVTVVDIGLESNFVPHCLGIFNSNEEAVLAIQNDMKSMIECAQDMDYELDDLNYVFRTTDRNYGAVWNNEEIEI